MYIPEEFSVNDNKKILDFISKYNFGMLIMNGIDGVPVLSHLPFVLKEKENEVVLEFHLAKANPQSQLIKNGGLAKVVVCGPNAYVSSSVYGHVNVPTFNYQAAHLIGSLQIMTIEELQNHSIELVNQFENGREKQIDSSKWPEEMLKAYSKEIVGVRLQVYSIDAAFKLSQNRNDEDYDAIINDLSKGKPNEQLVAEEMKKLRS